MRFKDESENGGGICSNDMYMIHLYCLAVQAGFYSNMLECWPVMQAARVQSPVAALVIRIFSPVTKVLYNFEFWKISYITPYGYYMEIFSIYRPMISRERNYFFYTHKSAIDF